VNLKAEQSKKKSIVKKMNLHGIFFAANVSDSTFLNQRKPSIDNDTLVNDLLKMFLLSIHVFCVRLL